MQRTLQKVFNMPEGMVFNFTNMFGEGRLFEQDVERFITDRGYCADAAVTKIREEGFASGHFSKDGIEEPVFFAKMPFVKDGNPNDKHSIRRLIEYGRRLKDYDAVIFFGVGGSYLGNKVLRNALGGNSWNRNQNIRQGYPRIYFCGNNLDAADCRDLAEELEYLSLEKSLKIMLIVISKSGTTVEPITGFLYFCDVLGAATEIELACTVVTDKGRPDLPLYALAVEKGWDIFDIKNGIGGRFSVMTDPGLLTLAALGGDIEEFLRGARDMDEYCREAVPHDNPALVNAALKFLAYGKGRDIEIFMPYSMDLKALSEWYVQLLAESLGKRRNRKGAVVNYGRTPIVAVGTTDMHAQTQQHQDGRLNKVIQFLSVRETNKNIKLVNPFKGNEFFDQYDGFDMHAALNIALESNEKALAGDERYSAKFIMPRINEYYLGQMMYFLMLSVAYEGEFADVDAYDQPGVEAYKKIMKQML